MLSMTRRSALGDDISTGINPDGSENYIAVDENGNFSQQTIPAGSSDLSVDPDLAPGGATNTQSEQVALSSVQAALAAGATPAQATAAAIAAGADPTDAAAAVASATTPWYKTTAGMVGTGVAAVAVVGGILWAVKRKK